MLVNNPEGFKPAISEQLCTLEMIYIGKAIGFAASEWLFWLPGRCCSITNGLFGCSRRIGYCLSPVPSTYHHAPITRHGADLGTGGGAVNDRISISIRLSLSPSLNSAVDGREVRPRWLNLQCSSLPTFSTPLSSAQRGKNIGPSA